jgi:hypothetical protein
MHFPGMHNVKSRHENTSTNDIFKGAIWHKKLKKTKELRTDNTRLKIKSSSIHCSMFRQTEHSSANCWSNARQCHSTKMYRGREGNKLQTLKLDGCVCGWQHAFATLPLMKEPRKM